MEGASGLETGHRFGLKLAELSRLWRQALDARLRPLGCRRRAGGAHPSQRLS